MNPWWWSLSTFMSVINFLDSICTHRHLCDYFAETWCPLFIESVFQSNQSHYKDTVEYLSVYWRGNELINNLGIAPDMNENSIITQLWCKLSAQHGPEYPRESADSNEVTNASLGEMPTCFRHSRCKNMKKFSFLMTVTDTLFERNVMLHLYTAHHTHTAAIWGPHSVPVMSCPLRRNTHRSHLAVITKRCSL